MAKKLNPSVLILLTSIIAMFDPTQKLLIAELACAHQGDSDLLHRLSCKALDAGFKAIKFQLMNAQSHMSSHHPLFGLVQSLEIPPEDWFTLFHNLRYNYPHALLIADIYDPASLILAKDLKPDLVKIHAADLGNQELVKDISQLNLPLLLGTGGSSYDEIESAIDIIVSYTSAPICLMFGFQSFPTQLSDFGLCLITTLKERFNLPIGFLDHIDASHRLAPMIPILAFAHGASVVEKHITLSRDLYPVDAESSLEPHEFSILLDNMHDYTAMLSASDFRALADSPSQQQYRNLMKKRCVLTKSVSSGTIITRDLICFKRASEGVFADNITNLIGKKLKSDCSCDQPITLEILI